ncbi:uncharacterized protein PG998_001015 [Apiospora kogelbergensis]|uniref:uncharacterized protein n=1 Tax=Apiospora kogelbergensis TaxID=1337665 RepID=UPI00312D9B0F
MFQAASRKSLLWLLAAVDLLPAAFVLAAPTEQQAVLKFGAGESQPQLEPSQRKLRGRFLHITDFHPDLYYQPHTSTEENYACHKGSGPAGVYGAETSDCDSPFTLVNATFAWLAKNVKDEVDFVIWTGDSARHDSDESIERTEKEVVKTNRMIADGLSGAFSDSQGLTIPIIPTFGNNDILPHNVMNAGPNRWLRKYLNVWRDFIPEAQRHAFEYGGWFYTEVVPNHLAVFSLNTLYFFDRNAGIDDCVSPSQPGYKQFAWLDAQFSYLRSRGMKAILMALGGDVLAKYTLWLQQYRDVIVGATYGHMNIDHFLIQDTHEIDLDLLDNNGEKSKKNKKGKKQKARESADPFFDDDQTVSIQGGKDYLVELREAWSKLPKSLVQQTNEVEAEKKKKKKKGKKNSDIGGAWAERFQLSLISPSVVPNYYPTYRIYEYNITGLEDASTWIDVRRSSSLDEENGLVPGSRPATQYPLVQNEEIDLAATEWIEGKKDSGSTLVIPEGPSKTATPGPAYSPQTLSFTGFTQYFANLTHINNDITSKSDSGAEISPRGWNEGKHRGKKPTHKPKPRDFNYEVEYSTFDDELYKLNDLTVRSFVELAYRIGQSPADSTTTQELRPGSHAEVRNGEDDDSDGANDDDDDDDDDDDEDNERIDAEKKKNKKKHKGKKKHRKKKLTELWLHFLEHAFVKTKTRDELKEDL